MMKCDKYQETKMDAGCDFTRCARYKIAQKLEFAIVDISSDLLMNLYCPRVSYTGNLRCRNIRRKINFIKSKLYRYMKQTHVM